MGGSDVAVILGLAPWADATPWKVWAELCGLIPYRQRTDDTPAKKLGRTLEAAVLAMYCEEAQLYVQPNLAQEPHEGPYPWMHATTDGYACPVSDKAVAGTEPETAHSVDAKINGMEIWDQLPIYYLTQGVWTNLCTGRTRTDFAVLHLRSRQLQVYPVERDEEIEQGTMQKVWDWYERHVVRGEVPEVDGSQATARIMAQVYSKVTGEDVPASAREIQQIRQLRAINEQMAALKLKKTRLENELRKTIGENNRLVDDEGRTVASWTQERQGRVQWGQLIRDHPTLANAYRSKDKPRTLRLTPRDL